MSDNPTADVLAAIGALHGDMIARTEGLRGELTELRGDVTQLRADMTQLRADVTQLRGDMIARTDGLRTDMTRLRVELMDRIDRLQHTVAGMQDEVFVNFSNAERVERVARAGHDETRALAEVVTAMQRQILKLTERVNDMQLRGDGHSGGH